MVGESFLRESQTFMTDKDKCQFEELNAILAGNALNLEAALQWATANQPRLEGIHSSLLFKLHKVSYLARLSQAVKMWQTILDLQPKRSRQDDVEMKGEENGDEPTKLQATVVENPSQSDFFAACQACCLYAKTHLAAFMDTKHSEEVVELMGAIAHI